jgi:hypothetical protein
VLLISPYIRLRIALQAFLNLVRWVVYEAHIETLELWTSVNAIIWGAWLFNPWMTVFNEHNIYATMALIPEWTWGAVAILAGCLQIAGRLYGHPSTIRIGARTLAALWMFGAAAIAVQNWRWASIITYPMMAAASLLVSYRAASYAKRAAPRPWEL